MGLSKQLKYLEIGIVDYNPDNWVVLKIKEGYGLRMNNAGMHCGYFDLHNALFTDEAEV